jgi:hypothetical protein
MGSWEYGNKGWGCIKILDIFRLAEKILGPHEGLVYMEIVGVSLGGGKLVVILFNHHVMKKLARKVIHIKMLDVHQLFFC